MADMTIVNGAFELSTTANGANTQSVILATENKFVDKNIVVKFTTPPAGTPTLSILDTSTSVTVGDASGGAFPLSTSLQGVTSYAEAGWVGTGGIGSATDSEVTVGTIAQSTMSLNGAEILNNGSITPSVTATQTISIGAGYETARTLTVNSMSDGINAQAVINASQQTSAPTLSSTTSTQSGKTQIIATPTTGASDIDEYYLAVTAVAPGITFSTTSISTTVTTAGFLGDPSQISTSVSTNGNTSLYYIPIASASATVAVTKQATNPIADSSAIAITGKTGITVIPTTSTTEIDTYYVPVRLIAPATTFELTDFTSTVLGAGYIDDTSLITSSGGTTQSESIYYIPITSGGLGTGVGSVTATGAAGNVEMELVSSAPNGYYIAISGQGQGIVGNTGWIEQGTTANSSVDTKYIKLNTATITQSLENGTVTVTEGYVPASGFSANFGRGTISSGTTSREGYADDNTEVPANGYLYLSAGYYPNTQIALSTMIPDDIEYTNAGTDTILSGFEAYDSNSNKLIGTIATYTGAYTIS